MKRFFELYNAEIVEAEEVEEIGSMPIYFEWSEQNKLTLDDSLFIRSLENTGFFTVRNDIATDLVHIQENIIKKVIPDDIKR